MKMYNRILLLACFLFSFMSGWGQGNIPRQAALDDIDSLVKTIERVHYNPYLRISKISFDQKAAKIKNSISDDIGFKELLLKINSITALLEDGHTMPYLVQPEIIADLKGLNFLPFRYAFSGNDVFLITEDARQNGIPAGSKIISVNGIKVSDALNEYQSLFGGSEFSKREMAGRLLNYFLFLKGIRPPFRVTYSVNNVSRTTSTDSAVTFMNMACNSMPHLIQVNSAKIIENRIGYISFLSMNGSLDEWGGLLDSAFTSFRQKNIRTLVIDTRDNPGGNSLYANYLLAYITKNKFLLASGKCWKVSEDKKRDMVANGSNNSEYQQKDNGTLWCYDDCAPKDNPVIADTVFNGEVYLLTGPFTFSSANMLADAFKTFKLGTIAGEPTGEYTNDFGETLLFTLPNSKIKIQTTTSFEFGADCNKTRLHTVIPDIEIKQTLKDKLSNNDNLIRFILEKTAAADNPVLQDH